MALPTDKPEPMAFEKVLVAEEEDDVPEEVNCWTNDDHVYSAQFFGYTPKAFSDGMYNGYIDYVQDGLKAIEDQILHQFKKYVRPEEAEQATANLLAQMVPVAAKAFDRFEMFVATNTFRIPDHVLLGEDAAHAQSQATLDDKRRVLDEINGLETQIVNARYMNAVFRRRIREVDAQSKLRRELESLVNAAIHTPKHSGLLGTVSESVEFVRSQIANIETTIEEIRTLEGQLSPDEGEVCRKRSSGSKDSSEQARKVSRNS